tara:strand:- start:68 stop:676 length:609 start_codon:yes stop_codon:yes gene_type:complete
MIKQGIHVTDYIKVYQVLTPELCQTIISATNSLAWNQHEWHNTYKNFNVNQNDTDKRKKLEENNLRFSEGMEYCDIDILLESTIIHELIKSIGKYSLLVGPQIDNRPSNLVSGVKSLRINRYKEGVGMKKHDDHAPDNEHPILTAIVMLTDDYEGGELILLDDYQVKLKVGEAVVFPSNFMYPHQVKKVTQGTRMTINAWFS